MRGAGLQGNLIGAAAELRVAAQLVKRGCIVFAPLVGCSEVDFIAMNEHGQIYRIQVKTPFLRWKNGKSHLRMRMTRSGKSEYRHVDLFIGVYEDSYWIVPATEPGRTPVLNRKKGHQWLEAWHLITGIPKELEQPKKPIAQLSLVNL